MARIKPQTLLLQSKKKKGPTRISLTTIIFCNLLVILVVLSLALTYRRLSNRSRNQAENDMSDLEDVNALGEPKKFDIPSFAVLDTTKGPITVELFKEASPEIMYKFLKLCQRGYFKGTLFHRVIKNYIIQAGDAQRSGVADDWILKGKPQNLLVMSPKHEAYMLGTTKAIHADKGFELFITSFPDLNDKLVIFGQVIKGEGIVQEIEEVDTDENDQPKSPVGIINISLRQDS